LNKKYITGTLILAILIVCIFSFPVAGAEGENNESHEGEWVTVEEWTTTFRTVEDSMYLGLFFDESIAYVSLNIEPEDVNEPDEYITVKYEGVGETQRSIRYNEEDGNYPFTPTPVRLEKSGLYPFSNYSTTFNIEGNTTTQNKSIEIPDMRCLEGDAKLGDEEIVISINRTSLGNGLLSLIILVIFSVLFGLSMMGFNWDPMGFPVSFFTAWGGVYLVLVGANIQPLPLTGDTIRLSLEFLSFSLIGIGLVYSLREVIEKKLMNY